jgi:hypothetical protein
MQGLAHFQKRLPVKIDVSQFNLAISDLIINTSRRFPRNHLYTRGRREPLRCNPGQRRHPQEILPKIFDFMFNKTNWSGLGLSISEDYFPPS